MTVCAYHRRWEQKHEASDRSRRNAIPSQCHTRLEANATLSPPSLAGRRWRGAGSQRHSPRNGTRPGRRHGQHHVLARLRRTEREQAVLSLLADGLLYKEIGEALGISVGTIKQHIHRMYEKLHVQNRTEAVNRYFGR